MTDREPVIPMFVYEPVILPNLKTSRDARHHIPAMALFDRGPIVVMHGVYGAVDVVAVIDKMDMVQCHRPPGQKSAAAPFRRYPGWSR